MIKCFITLCLVANPTMCLPPLQIEPSDGHPITSPMECARGAMIYQAQTRIADNPDTPTTRGNREQLVEGKPAPIQYFAKVNSYLEGDGSDIVPSWVEAEKRRLKAAEPQIK